MFVDLDDFKTVNDSLGHAAGDELLRTIAGRLEGALRAQDTAARLGGDEFAALLEDVVDEAEALEVAERVRRALEPPATIGTRELLRSASIGVACPPADATDEVLRNAGPSRSTCSSSTARSPPASTRTPRRRGSCARSWRWGTAARTSRRAQAPMAATGRTT
jgi:hypothetical protein